jgi:hypothetical protein
MRRICAFACLVLATFALSTSTRAQRLPAELERRGVPTPGTASDSLFGFITTNTTLTAGPPGPVWRVIGDLYVQPNATLTIEPGVTLLFESNSDLLNSGDYFSKSELIIRGGLHAVGVALDSIKWASSSEITASWGQVKLEPGSFGVLERVAMRHATRALNVGTSSFAAHDNLIENCTTGIVTYQGSQVIDRWSIRQARFPIEARSTSVSVINCNMFSRNVPSPAIGINAVLPLLTVRFTTLNMTGNNTEYRLVNAQCDSLAIQDSEFRLGTTSSGDYFLTSSTPKVMLSRIKVFGNQSHGVYQSLTNAVLNVSIDHLTFPHRTGPFRG